jgi:phosphate transport system substrate-binding protein
MNTMTKPALRSWLGRVLMLAVMLQPSAHAFAEQSVKLVGAGASFPAPLYLRWFRDYYRLHPKVKIDYQSIGSGGGIKDLLNGRIDFAGSELRLTDEQKAAVPGGVQQVPLTAGAIAVIYHLDGVDDLKLPRDVLVGILTGGIERWNDPALVAANPGAALPDAPITLVARSDASGTSYHFSRHLSTASTAFAEAIGTSMTPNWPDSLKRRGMLIRGRGNEGVAAFVRAIPASIGYVQYAYGHLSGMQMAALQNRAGDLVAPSQVSFEAALQALSSSTDPDAIADPPGSGSYPVIAVSWLVVRNEYADPAKRRALLDFVDYALGPGQDVSEKLGYIRFSSQAADYVRGLLDPAGQPGAD